MKLPIHYNNNRKYTDCKSRDYKFKSRFYFGVTLVELLVVLGVISIVTVAIIPSFNLFSSNQVLDQSMKNFIGDVKVVQQKSLAGITQDGVNVNWAIRNCAYGDASAYELGYVKNVESKSEFVAIEEKSLISPMLFKNCISYGETGNNSVPTETVNESGQLVGKEESSSGTSPLQVSIIGPGTITGSGAKTLEFQRLSGQLPDGTNQIEFQICSDKNCSVTKRLIIYKQGKMEVVDADENSKN